MVRVRRGECEKSSFLFDLKIVSCACEMSYESAVLVVDESAETMELAGADGEDPGNPKYD